jgi:hypothetical protein
MGVVLPLIPRPLEHFPWNDICAKFSNRVTFLPEVRISEYEKSMDGEDGYGCWDAVGISDMGEWSFEIFENPVQYHQSLLRLYPTIDLHLPSKFYAQNEVILYGAFAHNWQDNFGDLHYATPYLVDIQRKNDPSIFARLASGQSSIGDIFLRHTLSEITQPDIASP